MSRMGPEAESQDAGSVPYFLWRSFTKHFIPLLLHQFQFKHLGKFSSY